MGFPSMIRDLHCTEFQATAGLSVFTLGFGVVPLVTASFSEEFGRLPLYIVSGLGFLLMSPMIALYVGLHLIMVMRLTLNLHKVKKHPDGYCGTLFTRRVWLYSGDYGWWNDL